MNLNHKNIKKSKGFFLLKGGRLYDPFLNVNDNYDILIKDGRINSIKKRISKKNV